MDARQTAQVNQVVGAVGMPPPQSQTQDAWVDPQFVMMRGSTRDKIFEYIGRKQTSADWRRRLPELARRLEELLFRKYPSKAEYYNMMKQQIEPHLQFAIKQLSALNQQRQQNQQLSRQISSSPGNGTMILTPGITQGTSETSRMSYVTGDIGPSSSGAGMVPLNANMGCVPYFEILLYHAVEHLTNHLSGSLASVFGKDHPLSSYWEAPDQHVNTLLSLGMNPTHQDHPRDSNNNLMIDTADTPATNRFLLMVMQKSRAPLKEIRKEPKFSCPVCMNELVDASSTICGHIFCQKCIQASIQAQSKCPTCRRTLTMNSFHRVYLPTMD
uniref:Putative histone acetyltransferase HAC-like protein 1 n=1 Tax=Aegilops tauschii TaxID=37682 RepID=R7VZH8_AEGTA